MDESYLMSDSVTASTFIVTPDGELITFEEYQKTKINPDMRKKTNGFLNNIQHPHLSRNTINNILKNNENGMISEIESNSLGLKQSTTKTGEQKILLNDLQNVVQTGLQRKMLNEVRNGVQNGVQIGTQNRTQNTSQIESQILTKNSVQTSSNKITQKTVHNGCSSFQQARNATIENNNKKSNSNSSGNREHVSSLLRQLNNENLTTSQHQRADEIYQELLSELRDLTKFNTEAKQLTGLPEIDLLRHTNTYLTQIQNEVTELQSKLAGDIDMK